MITTPIPQFPAELEERFNAAVGSNGVACIAACITDDWLLVTPKAGPVPQSRILDVVGSGGLTHSSMSKRATRAVVVGDIAWVAGRAERSSTFSGAPMQADE